MPHDSIDPPTGTPNPDEDVALLATTIGVRQSLSQVVVAPRVVQDSDTIEPSQLVMGPFNSVVEPSQTIIEPSQSAVEPSQPVVKSSQSIVEPSQSVVTSSQVVASSQVGAGPPQVVGPSQVVAEPSQVVVEPPRVVVGSSQVAIKPSPSSVPESPNVSIGVAPMDTQPDSTVTITPSQPPTKLFNITSSSATPKVPYRVRDPATKPSGKSSRRGSIEGAPEVIIDLIDDEETVDLSDYINMEFGDNESQVSSSQKTADCCRELTPPPSDSQQRHASVGGTGGSTSQTEFASGRTRPQLNVDEGDLPSWMTKKGQWKYVASTAGGTAWENLLKIYMDQERRLEFTEIVSGISRIFPTSGPKQFKGRNSHERGSTIEDQGVLPVCSSTIAR